MPQDSEEEQKAQMPFDLRIGQKVNELKDSIEKMKSSVPAKILGLKE